MPFGSSRFVDSLFQQIAGKYHQLYQYVKQTIRKETLSPEIINRFSCPPPMDRYHCGRRAFFFTSLKAGLTIEASVVVPVFAVCMIALISVGNVIRSAQQFAGALCETGEKMAISGYVYEYGEGSNILTGILSAAYARSSVMGKVKERSLVKNENFLLSSFLDEEDRIDLVLTYQMKLPVGMVTPPWYFFLQRGCVRAWTGRKGSGGDAESSQQGEGSEIVYVTDTGSVYHEDINCSHIRLSIQQIPWEGLDTYRNTSGGKYHACERCRPAPGGAVYITQDGDRYHSSLECSGLRRSVHEATREEVGSMRGCSRCARRK